MRWWFRARVASIAWWIFLLGWAGTFVDSSVRFAFPTLAGGQFASVPVASLSATIAATGWVSITVTRSRELSSGTSRRWAWGGDLAMLACALTLSAAGAALGLGGARAALVPLLFQSAVAVWAARPGGRTGWLVAPGVALLATMLLGFDSLGNPAVWGLPAIEDPSAPALVSSTCFLAAATGWYLVCVIRNPAATGR